ncbi:hypothetical protein Tco_1180583 [Tanacetum coccineum]
MGWLIELCGKITKRTNTLSMCGEGIYTSIRWTWALVTWAFHRPWTSYLYYISWYQRPEVPVKMPPRRNRPLTEACEQELEQRVMARMEERLDQFVD